jgi:predicted porin
VQRNGRNLESMHGSVRATLFQYTQLPEKEVGPGCQWFGNKPQVPAPFVQTLEKLEMKKSLVALAALAATSAFAQSSVTLYGTLDVGFGTTSNTLAADPNAASNVYTLPGTGAPAAGRVTGLMSSNQSASKWGIKGVEDMGSGLKTSFVLESAINPNFGTNPNGRVNDSLPGTGSATAGSFTNGEGSLQGQMFDREATLGIAGNAWSLKGGRQLTVMADTIGAYDPLPGYATSPLTFNGGYSGAGFTGEARWDNALKFEYANGASKVALGYKTGMMSSNQGGTNQGQGVAAAYEYAQANYGVKLAYEANKDAMAVGNGGLSTPSLKITFADTSALTLAGRYKYGSNTTFKFGVEHIITKNPSNAANDTAANYAAINGLPVAVVAVASYNTQRTQNMYWIGANYELSGTSEVGAAFYQLNTSAYGSSGATLLDTSKEQIFSLAYTYKFSKRTKMYVTAMTSQLSGPAWNGAGGVVMPNVQTFTTGIVHNF